MSASSALCTAAQTHTDRQHVTSPDSRRPLHSCVCLPPAVSRETTERQRDRETEKRRGRETESWKQTAQTAQTALWRDEGQQDNGTDRQTDRQTDRLRSRQTDRVRGRQRDLVKQSQRTDGGLSVPPAPPCPRRPTPHRSPPCSLPTPSPWSASSLSSGSYPPSPQPGGEGEGAGGGSKVLGGNITVGGRPVSYIHRGTVQ